MKQNLLEMVHTDEVIFVWSFKYANGRQTRSSGAKTGLLRRAGAKTSLPGDTRNVGGRRGLSFIVILSNCVIWNFNCFIMRGWKQLHDPLH